MPRYYYKPTFCICILSMIVLAIFLVTPLMPPRPAKRVSFLQKPIDKVVKRPQKKISHVGTMRPSSGAHPLSGSAYNNVKFINKNDPLRDTKKLFPKYNENTAKLAGNAPIAKRYFDNLADKHTNASNLSRGFSESAAMATIPKGSRGGIRNQEQFHRDAVKRAKMANRHNTHLVPTPPSFPHL